ncbi:MAG: N-acetylmuramoyl-L-alanine amidase [Archangium sp.]
MIRTVALTLVFLSATARADSADEAYQSAKDSYAKLKGDQKRRALRHHWQNVAKKFDAVAAKYPRSDRAPEALFNSGELYNELSRFSAKDEDREASERAYRKLMDGWPKHKLADDAALSLARMLANHEGDVRGARRVIEAALKNAGDKKKALGDLLATLPRSEKDDDAPVVAKKSKDAEDESAPAAKKSDVASKKGKSKKSADDDQADEVASKKSKKSDDAKKLKDLDDDQPVVVAKAVTAKKEAPPTDVAEAIRRAIKPLENVTGVGGEGPLTAQARRLPTATRPDDDPPARADEDDVDEGEEPVVTSLAERLRDVRIGARKPIDESEAKSRLQKLMKADAGSDITLAQQLGLKVRRVIIDAGHGGHDTGAIGPKGTKEKDVALAIAKKLAAQLEAAGLEVILTRDDDTFVKLEDRTRFANKQKGDLFISIHCNAAPTKTLRGIETYTLNTSSNRYSIRLAARENATTERGVGDLQYILADLATKANTGESSQLAERVQRSLVRDLSGSYKGVKDLGTKEALFFVLLGARMPAILVETSFLSHPEEEERLADEDYQQKIADSISESVTGFLEDRNKLAQVD